MSAPAFALPAALQATSPPEARGIARDAVRLLIARRHDGGIEHARFDQLPGRLAAGDLVVVNVSATLPAAVPGRRADGSAVRVHFATRAPALGPRWRVVEVRSPDGARPERGRPGERIGLGRAAAVELELVTEYASGSRLLLARLHGPVTVEQCLARFGRPIRYGYVEREWPLSAYQNVYALSSRSAGMPSGGSAEMPSAGRPLTARLITALVAGGVAVAPITLHTGVSSPERHEPPVPEEYEVPPATARLVARARAAGGRVIAVGTTVVRALETAAQVSGAVKSGRGWTNLMIEPDRGVRVVDGLITGWHEPAASHLLMLEAIAGPELLERSYRAALEQGYLWHEFGDSHLVLS